MIETLLVLLLYVAGAVCVAVGVFLMFGLGAALIVAGAFLMVAGTLLVRGIARVSTG